MMLPDISESPYILTSRGLHFTEELKRAINFEVILNVNFSSPLSGSNVKICCSGSKYGSQPSGPSESASRLRVLLWSLGAFR